MLKFLHRKNSFLIPSLAPLRYVLIQPHFDYACPTWYPNLTKKLKCRIQTTQNKWICFCLQLDKLKHISHEEFGHLNQLLVAYRFKQYVKSVVLKYLNKQSPNCLNEVFDVASESNFQLRCSFQKLKCPFVRLIPVNLLCIILVQLFGIKPCTFSGVLTILMPPNIIWKNIS